MLIVGSPPSGNVQIIGSCSLCKGDVTVPVIWMGTIPPVPTCSKCGAKAKPPEHGTIPMEKR